MSFDVIRYMDTQIFRPLSKKTYLSRKQEAFDLGSVQLNRDIDQVMTLIPDRFPSRQQPVIQILIRVDQVRRKRHTDQPRMSVIHGGR